MPERLMKCVRDLMDKGKSKEEAFPICIKSTGLKPHKKKKKKAHLDILLLADHLDVLGLYKEATNLDEILQKQAQWKWFKEKGRQLKDWVQTERERDPQKRQALTDIRQSHWNLISQINATYQLLDNAGKNMHNPDVYIRDLDMALNALQRDLGQALAMSQRAVQRASELGMGPALTLEQRMEGMQPGEREVTTPGVEQQVEKLKELQQQYPGAGRTEPSRPLSPEETPTELIRAPRPRARPIVSPEAPVVWPGQTFQPGQLGGRQSKAIYRLLKLADCLDERGDIEAANKIDNLFRQAQLGWAKEKGTQLGDLFRSQVGVVDENVRQKHYEIMERLKQLYDNLQTLRRNITDPNYLAKFQEYIQAASAEFQRLSQEAQEVQQLLGTLPAASPTGEQPQQEMGEPLVKDRLDVNLQEALKTLTPQQKERVLQIIQQSQRARGQGV